MSWNFSRALVAEYSGASSSGGGPSVLSRSMPPRARNSWPDKTTAPSSRSRSGRMSAPSPHETTPCVPSFGRFAARCFSDMSLPKPYYQDDAVTLYHGDCRQIVPLLGRFDLLLTDPPYGIGAGKMNLGKWRTSRMQKMDWDSDAPPAWVLAMLLDSAEDHIIWGGNYYELPPSRQYLIWDKGAGFRGRDFAECEQAWCSSDGNARIFARDPLAAGDYRGKEHPTEKPAELMRWCLTLRPEAVTVLDAFAGSGTTGRACKDLGRKCTLIEREEAYCEIIARRMGQEVLAL
jgi:hypothetical protein